MLRIISPVCKFHTQIFFQLPPTKIVLSGLIARQVITSVGQGVKLSGVFALKQ